MVEETEAGALTAWNLVSCVCMEEMMMGRGRQAFSVKDQETKSRILCNKRGKSSTNFFN